MRYKTLKAYINRVISLLKESGLYRPGLEPHIIALATALRNLDKINADIGTIESCTYPEKTAYGVRIQENPLFGMAGKQLAAIARAAKPMGLDFSKLLADTEDDPLVELTQRLAAGDAGNQEIIRPKE